MQLGLKEFTSEFQLRDRTMTEARRQDGVITLVFDLMHADDPMRCDETKSYPLVVELEEHVTQIDAFEEFSKGPVFAEVIKCEIIEKGMQLLAFLSEGQFGERSIDITTTAQRLQVRETGAETLQR